MTVTTGVTVVTRVPGTTRAPVVTCDVVVQGTGLRLNGRDKGCTFTRYCQTLITETQIQVLRPVPCRTDCGLSYKIGVVGGQVIGSEGSD